MTSKRDLKKRIRERAARTGERYTTARQHMVGEPERGGGGVHYVELEDLTEEAARVGIRCTVSIQRELARRLDCSALLVRIRDVLRALERDPSTEPLRAVMLRGEEPVVEPVVDDSPPRRRSGQPSQHGAKEQAVLVADAMRLARGREVYARQESTFHARVRAGIGGISETGTMLALPATGKRGLEMIVCALWGLRLGRLQAVFSPRTVSVVLMTPDAFFFDVMALSEAARRGTPPRARSGPGRK